MLCFKEYKLTADIDGTVGIYGGVLPSLSDLQETTHVTVAQSRRGQMGNDILSVSDDGKALPAGLLLTGQPSPHHPGAAEAEAFKGTAQIGAAVPCVLMTEHGQGCAVGVAHDRDAFYLPTSDHRLEAWDQGAPHLQKASVGVP